MTAAAEHFDQAVARAVEYLDAGNPPGAMASLITDLGRHDGTSTILTPDDRIFLAGLYAVHGADGVRQFIADLPRPPGTYS